MALGDYEITDRRRNARLKQLGGSFNSPSDTGSMSRGTKDKTKFYL